MIEFIQIIGIAAFGFVLGIAKGIDMGSKNND